MAPGIVRAADRVAIWHQAAEKDPFEGHPEPHHAEIPSYVEPPTSPPPTGVTPPGPPPVAPVVIPKSNKFAPAKQLKKLLDETIDAPSQTYPEHTHPSVKAFTDKYPGFAQTYLKPQYQDALKASLGEKNYDKLLYHMPAEHHQALTQHVQKPAPNSKKFTTPTNQLKKLLANPNTTPEHVQAFIEKNPGYAKTYLHNPSYQQAIKSHVGEKNYDDWQEHLTPGQKSTAHPDDTDEYIKTLQESGYPKEKAKSTEQNILDAFTGPGKPWKQMSEGEFFGPGGPASPASGPGAEPTDQAAKTHGDALQQILKNLTDQGVQDTPKLHEYLNDLDTPTAHNLADMPDMALSHYQDFGPGQQEPTDQDDIEAISQQMGGDPWNPPAAPPQELNPKQDLLNQFAQDNPDWAAQHGQTLQSPEFKKWFDTQPQHYQDSSFLSPTKTMQDFAEAGQPAPAGGDVPAQPPPSANEEAEKHQVLTDAIKTVFPNTAIDFGNSSVEELKHHLENFKTHLKGTPGLEKHVQQIEDLYEQHFGEGAMQPAATPNKKKVIDDLKALGLPLNYDKYQKTNTPEELQQALQDAIDYSATHKAPKSAEGIQSVYDKHFGQGAMAPQQPVPSAPQAQPPAPSEDIPAHQDDYGDWHHDESKLPPGFKNWATDSGVPLENYSPDELKAALQGGWANMSPERQAQYAQGEPQTLGDAWKQAFPNSGELAGDTPEQQLQAFMGSYNSFKDDPQYADQLQKIHDQFVGGEQQPAPSAPHIDPNGYLNQDFMKWFEQNNNHIWGAQPGHDKELIDMLKDPNNKWGQTKVKAWLKSVAGTNQDPHLSDWEKELSPPPEQQLSVGQKIKALKPDITPTAEQLDATLGKKTPEQIKKMFDNTIEQYPDIGGDLQAIYDQHYGQPASLGTSDSAFAQHFQTSANDPDILHAKIYDFLGGISGLSQGNKNEIAQSLMDQHPDDLGAYLQQQYPSAYKKWQAEHQQQPVPATAPQQVDVEAIKQDMQDILGWSPSALGLKKITGTPEQIKAQLQKWLDTGSYPGVEEVLDKHFGAGTAQKPMTQADWNVIHPGYAQWFADNMAGASAEEQKEILQSKAQDSMTGALSTAAKTALDKHFGGGVSPAGGPPPFDPESFYADYMKAFPDTAYTKAELTDPQFALQKVQQMSGQAGYPPSSVAAKKFKALWEKHFGGGTTPAAPAAQPTIGGIKQVLIDNGWTPQATGLADLAAMHPDDWKEKLESWASGVGAGPKGAQAAQMALDKFYGAPAGGGPAPFDAAAIAKGLGAIDPDYYDDDLVDEIAGQTKKWHKTNLEALIKQVESGELGTPDQLAKYKTLHQKYFGGGATAGGAVSPAPGVPPVAWMKDQLPGVNFDIANKGITGDEITQQQLNDWAADNPQSWVMDKWSQEPDPDKYLAQTGTPAGGDAYAYPGASFAGVGQDFIDSLPTGLYYDGGNKAPGGKLSPGAAAFLESQGYGPQELKALPYNSVGSEPSQVSLMQAWLDLDQEAKDQFAAQEQSGGGAPVGGGYDFSTTPTAEQLQEAGLSPQAAANFAKLSPGEFQSYYDKLKSGEIDNDNWEKIVDWVDQQGGAPAATKPFDFSTTPTAEQLEQAGVPFANAANIAMQSPGNFKENYDWAKEHPGEGGTSWDSIVKWVDQQGGGGTAAPPGYDGPPAAWIKKHYPDTDLAKQDDAGVADWWTDHHDSFAGEAWKNDEFGDKAEHQAQQGGGPSGAAPTPLPQFDWSQFGPEFKELFPKSDWATGSDPGMAAAEQKLKAAVDVGNANYAGTPKSDAANALYEKWFGPVGGGGPAPTPAGGKAVLWGGGTAPSPEDQDEISEIKQYQENEEDPGVSAPAKSEQPTAEDLTAWSATKPSTPPEWKDFAAWWGKTQLTPEQEQGIYQSWFPGKQVTPEFATGWMKNVYDHHSKPSTGDLAAQGMPAWATTSWALGDKAQAEWPVFQTWANNDAGIPKGTNIKQKLAIWKGLNAADKKEIAENYMPATPIDTKAVVGELQQAFPDSDFSKWAAMPQGTLKTNVELLAKSGYNEAIPIFNNYFGGKIPMPKAVEKKAPEAAPAPVLKIVPPSKVPDWVKSQWGSNGTVGEAEAKDYTELKHFADSIGVDVTGDTYPYPLIKQWNAIPKYLQNQISSMPQLPWTDKAGLDAWVAAQPKIIDQLAALKPEMDWSNTGYGSTAWAFTKPMTGSYVRNMRSRVGTWIEEETDPQKKQQLLDVYHHYFGNGKTTLAQSLSAIYPNEDWDKKLKSAPTPKVMSELKKRLKTEKDPEKWAQLVDVWAKYFPHPDNPSKVAPTGITQLTKGLKYVNPGDAVPADDLKALKYWKHMGNPGADVLNNWHADIKAYDDGPYIQSKKASKDKGGYPAYHGWTPPGSAAGETFKADPAMLGSSGPTYTVPQAAQPQQDTKDYTTLMDVAKQHKADSPLKRNADGTVTSAGLSKKDLDVMRSEEFKNWWVGASRGYRNTYQHHPSVALEDFQNFMQGGDLYGQVPGGEDKFTGGDKYLDVSPYGALPKKNAPFTKALPGAGGGQSPAIPRYLLHNPPKSKRIKFPRREPPPGQETLPLSPGEHFAPDYAPMPIYRLMRLKLDEEPHAPDWVKGSKARELHVQQQKARLRRIDEIVNGKEAARKFQTEAAEFKSFAAKHHLDEQAKDDLELELFSPKQGEFPDEKWKYFEDFAKQHSIAPQEMYDLASKMEVMPPTEPKGNYEHPELAKLVLDYLENGGGIGASGVGTHWTRDFEKAQLGFKQSGIFGPEKMKSTYRNLPILMYGLWSGRGETEGHEGGAFDPIGTQSADTEREQNLMENAPIFIHRMQLRGQEAGGAADPWGKNRDDWHDVMDHIPLSMIPPGPNETASQTAGGYKTPERLILDKPSLAQALQQGLGGGAEKPETSWQFAKQDWDHLTPGHRADMMFNELVGKLGPHPEQTHPDELARIRKIYQMFFVGRPDMPVKPHTRRASLDTDTAEQFLILRMARFADDEYAQHTQALDDTLEDHFARQQDSRHLHGIIGADDKTHWSPSRLRAQRKAIDRAWAELNGDDVPQQGKAMLLGGLAGSGKGSLYDHPDLGLHDYLPIDPDFMKKIMAKEGMVPNIEGYSPMESSPLVHHEASELATRLAERAYRQGRNVVWDTTMGNERATNDTINRLRQSGYHTVDAAFMKTNPQIARRRSEQRHRADEEAFRDGVGQGGMGGRWVPHGVSRWQTSSPGSGAGSRPESVFNNIRSKVDNTAEFNGDTTPATLVRKNGPVWGGTDFTPPPLTATAAVQLHSVRALVESYEHAELSFDQLVAALAAADYSERPHGRDLAEHYHNAAEHPDDNDFFWVDSAHDRDVINDEQRQQILDAIDAHHGGGDQLAQIEARIERLAGIDDLPPHMTKPHWLSDYDGYGQVPGEVQDHWKDFLNRLDDDEIAKYSDQEKYGNQGKGKDYSDDYEIAWSDYLDANGVKPSWEYEDDDDDDDDDDYDDEGIDPDYSDYEDEEGGDFEGEPPEPQGDRPVGWSKPAPFIKRDPEGRQYFPSTGLNPASNSYARPEVDWEEAEHEQEPLPFQQGIVPGQQPSPGGQHQLFDVRGGPEGYEWPHDPEPVPLYRGFPMMLKPDQKGNDPLGWLRRSLYGGDYETDTGTDSTGSGPTGNKALARPHPLGFDNPELGTRILEHLKTNKPSPDSKSVGLGRHWTTDENMAHQYAQEGTGGGTSPLMLSVKVRAKWKGLGEDPYRSNTGGHWPNESEVTMTKGAPMDIDSVQIRHPQTGEWHEVLDAPSSPHMATVRRLASEDEAFIRILMAEEEFSF